MVTALSRLAAMQNITYEAQQQVVHYLHADISAVARTEARAKEIVVLLMAFGRMVIRDPVKDILIILTRALLPRVVMLTCNECAAALWALERCTWADLQLTTALVN